MHLVLVDSIILTSVGLEEESLNALLKIQRILAYFFKNLENFADISLYAILISFYFSNKGIIVLIRL